MRRKCHDVVMCQECCDLQSGDQACWDDLLQIDSCIIKSAFSRDAYCRRELDWPVPEVQLN